MSPTRPRARGGRVGAMSDQVSAGKTECPNIPLGDGEQIIWWSRPDLKEYIKYQYLYDLVFHFIVVIGSCFIIYSMSDNFNQNYLLIILFLISNLWIFSKFYSIYIEAKSMMYALTSQNAVLKTERQIRSINLKSIRMLDMKKRNDSLGDVLFIDHPVGIRIDGRQTIRDGFIGIADAEKVMREMRRLQAEA
jgi:hypothetical protein